MSAAATLPQNGLLILAPRGRDAVVAKEILRDAKLHADICLDIDELMQELSRGADVAVLTEEAIRARHPALWRRGFSRSRHGRIFRSCCSPNTAAASSAIRRRRGWSRTLGNVTFLERPFHPTTLVSVVQTGLRGRQRQYECRRLNEELESRVQERTGELATANRQLLNQIKERESVESTLRQMQRLEAVGQLTSGVAHDFNNLLTVVLGNHWLSGKGHRQCRDRRQAEAAARLYARGRRARRQAHRSAAVVFAPATARAAVARSQRDGRQYARPVAEHDGRQRSHIETRLQHGLWPAMVDPTQLELAVLNLAINARDAMEIGGSLTVATDNAVVGPPMRPEEPPAGEYVSVCVSDTGTGMSEEIRAKVFEPFFTTKEVGKGSGLGLSQVLGFAKQSGGGVRINSRLGEGTTVYIYLPRAEAGAARFGPAPRPTVWAGQRRNATILLVDDDNEVREVTRAMLHDLGHIVLEAGSGATALDVLQRQTGIDLLIVDFAMPGMNGAELARLAHARQSDLPVLFVTGFADRGGLAGVDDAFIVGKPFHYDELAGKVQLALGTASAANVVRLRR